MSNQLELALKACKLIVAVKHCMMFYHVHADWAANEVLIEQGFTSVQELAKEAETIAEEALIAEESLEEKYENIK